MKRIIALLLIISFESSFAATLFIKPTTEQTIQQGDVVKLEIFLVVKKHESLQPLELYNKVLGKTLFIMNPQIIKEQETAADKNYLIDADVVFSNEVTAGQVLSHDFKTSKLNIIISNVIVPAQEAQKEFMVFDQDFYPELNIRQFWQNIGAIILLFSLVGFKFYRKQKRRRAAAQIIQLRAEKINSLINKIKNAERREDFEAIYLQKQMILAESLVPAEEFRKMISKIENYLFKKELSEFEKNEIKKSFNNFANTIGRT
ncbi:MAG: hypothetical protein JNM93_10275 [Bacteriovoracaceae bacterium]|nr:hypothetical protein [Bacteriovoracaceae bacterium]